MHFNWEVNLGHVLMIAAMVGSMTVAYAAYAVTVSSMDARIAYLEGQSKSQISTNGEMLTALFGIKQDVAVIKDRLERTK